MIKLILCIVMAAMSAGCVTSRIYDLDQYKIPSDDPNGLPSIQAKWQDFDYILTKIYMPLDWNGTNRYYSCRNLVILRTSKSNHSRFLNLLRSYWGVSDDEEVKFEPQPALPDSSTVPDQTPILLEQEDEQEDVAAACTNVP